MKLLTKTTLILLGITLLLFSVGGIFLIGNLKSTIREEADADLISESELIRSLLDISPELAQFEHPAIDITPVKSADIDPGAFHYSDTLIPPQVGGLRQAGHYRVISLYEKKDSQLFKIQVFHPSIGDQELYGNIFYTLLIISIAIILLITLTVVLVSQRLWKPFNQALARVEQFNVQDPEAPEFGESNTLEFKRLNENLRSMTQKAVADYRQLKEFSENASHELQTPLAIIRAKLDVLVQSENLNDRQGEALNAALEAVRRLSYLNQGLLNLHKIKNQQFGPGENLDLGAYAQKHLGQIKELLELKELKVQREIKAAFWVKINENEADILISNLFRNAMVHNQKGGMIRVEVSPTHFRIGNSAEGGPLDASRIFERFSKGREEGSNTGLGLAIVRQICEGAKLEIRYSFEEGMHFFSLF